MKKKFAIPSAIALLGLIALYFFTPGALLGDIRHINSDSQIRIHISRYYERRVVGHVGVHGLEPIGAIDLDAEQAAALGELLRGSWYTRRPGRPAIQTLHFSFDQREFYYTFWVVFYGERGVMYDIRIGHDGLVLRSNHRFSRLRIRNAEWKDSVLEILGLAE